MAYTLKDDDMFYIRIPSLLSVGYGGLLHPAVKRPWREHLVPRLAMRGAIPPFLQHVLMAWCLIKQEIRLHGVVLS